MLKNRIIPCLDVKNGRVVKGVSFENLVDAGDPITQGEFYYHEGADELCFLDISATSENRGVMLDMVKKVSKKCFMPLTVGGGIREVKDFSDLLESGADKVSVNSAAITNPDLINQAAKKFGSQCVIIAIDAKKDESGNYKIFSHSAKKPTGIDAIDWAKKMQDLGAGEILLTSIDRDGSKQGYDLELINQISNSTSIPIIASGGVGNLQHLVDGIKAGANAVLAASIFHFKEYSIKEAKEFMQKAGIDIRI